MSHKLPTVIAVATPLLFAIAAGAALPAHFTTNTTVDTVDAMPGDGVCADAMGMCSLRAAVQEANALGGNRVIALEQGATYLFTIAGAGENLGATGDLDVTGTIRIQGNGAEIDAAALDRAFDVQTGGRLYVQDLSVLNGFVTAESGGGYRSMGELRIMDSAITDCVATGTGASGGAVMNDRGFLHLLRVTMAHNDATRAGGAVEANEGMTLLVRTTAMSNTTGPTPGNGGGFHLTGPGDVQISYSTFVGNTAGREGGGVWNSSTGSMTIDNSRIEDNSANGTAADDGGGGVFNDGGFLTISHSTITGNTALPGSASGGGVFNNNGDLYILRSTIAGNTATRAGGGVEALTGSTWIFASTLADNDTGAAPGNGGGLHLTGAGDVTVENSVVTRNTASAEGGGLWNSSTGTMTIAGCTITDNVASGALADQGGGGVFNDGGMMTIDNTDIMNNSADGAAGSGGGVLNDSGDLTIADSTISFNLAPRAGGGVEADTGTTRIFSTVLEGNETGAAPGNGGGFHITGTGTVLVEDSMFRMNHASNQGGGIWNSATGTMTINRTRFVNNTALMGPQGWNVGGTVTFNGNPIPPSMP